MNQISHTMKKGILSLFACLYLNTRFNLFKLLSSVVKLKPVPWLAPCFPIIATRESQNPRWGHLLVTFIWLKRIPHLRVLEVMLIQSLDSLRASNINSCSISTLPIPKYSRTRYITSVYDINQGISDPRVVTIEKQGADRGSDCNQIGSVVKAIWI